MFMCRFAFVLKQGASVNLFDRPFWRDHAAWREWFFPPYSQWVGFGDNSEVCRELLLDNADLTDFIRSQVSRGEESAYCDACRKRGSVLQECAGSVPYAVFPLLYFAHQSGEENGQSGGGQKDSDAGPQLKVYPDIGWAGIRTSLSAPDRDIAFYFRSSPYGSCGASHANNNDFIMHIAGSVMAMPSGYSTGYRSPHLTNWVWHTKSHNCVTLSGASQKLKSFYSRGWIVNPAENEDLVYFCGIADESYDHVADLCRRHVIYLKKQRAFVFIECFAAKRNLPVSFQWNIHTWHDITLNEDECSFLITDTKSNPLVPRLQGNILYRHNYALTRSTGWDPEPTSLTGDTQFRNQFHVTFSTGELVEDLVLPVVLRAGWEENPAGSFRWEREETAEVLVFDKARVAVFQSGEIISKLVVSDAEYTISNGGLESL